jgi:hypothetical protein
LCFVRWILWGFFIARANIPWRYLSTGYAYQSAISLPDWLSSIVGQWQRIPLSAGLYRNSASTKKIGLNLFKWALFLGKKPEIASFCLKSGVL